MFGGPVVGPVIFCKEISEGPGLGCTVVDIHTYVLCPCDMYKAIILPYLGSSCKWKS